MPQATKLPGRSGFFKNIGFLRKKFCPRQRNCPGQVVSSKKIRFLIKSSAPGSEAARDKWLLQKKSAQAGNNYIPRGQHAANTRPTRNTARPDTRTNTHQHVPTRKIEHASSTRTAQHITLEHPTRTGTQKPAQTVATNTRGNPTRTRPARHGPPLLKGHWYTCITYVPWPDARAGVEPSHASTFESASKRTRIHTTTQQASFKGV